MPPLPLLALETDLRLDGWPRTNVASGDLPPRGWRRWMLPFHHHSLKPASQQKVFASSQVELHQRYILRHICFCLIVDLRDATKSTAMTGILGSSGRSADLYIFADTVGRRIRVRGTVHIQKSWRPPLATRSMAHCPQLLISWHQLRPMANVYTSHTYHTYDHHEKLNYSCELCLASHTTVIYSTPPDIPRMIPTKHSLLRYRRTCNHRRRNAPTLFLYYCFLLLLCSYF